MSFVDITHPHIAISHKFKNVTVTQWIFLGVHSLNWGASENLYTAPKNKGTLKWLKIILINIIHFENVYWWTIFWEQKQSIIHKIINPLRVGFKNVIKKIKPHAYSSYIYFIKVTSKLHFWIHCMRWLSRLWASVTAIYNCKNVSAAECEKCIHMVKLLWWCW